MDTWTLTDSTRALNPSLPNERGTVTGEPGATPQNISQEQFQDLLRELSLVVAE